VAILPEPRKFTLKGSIMEKHRQLTAEQENEAKLLEVKIRKALDQEISEIARVLVSSPENELFGQTEFQIRDLLLRAGARSYEEHLREKKTAIEARR
jgi:hypothetical protein